jgi:hypothetical protein
MKARFWLTSLVVATTTVAVRPTTTIIRAADTHPTPRISSLDDQIDLAVTVYNSDIALVRDVRDILLPRGSADLRFMDIAATVNPATVHFRSVTDPAHVSVLEQNYEYDLLDPDQLLRKYVGRDVVLVRAGRDGRQDEVKARLLSYNKAPVWQVGSEIVTGLNADSIRFPELPGNLYTRPTLLWTLDNSGGARHRIEASYLATKLSWSADYVLTVARDDRAADLDGWITLVNGSGTTFNRAQLQLVAGDVNRVRRTFARALDAAAPMADKVAAPPVAEESFSEYHLYSLGRRTSIATEETKQLSLLNASSIGVRKTYVVSGQPFYYRSRQNSGQPMKEPVQVYYEFRNEKSSGLGMALPAGVVRIYQADSRGGTQFVGEDRIAHTPVDESLRLKIGTAFDITCERIQTDYQKVGATTYESAYDITIRNHKTTAVTVDLREPIGGSWKILQATLAPTKLDAWTTGFSVPVAADGTAVVNYRVRTVY